MATNNESVFLAIIILISFTSVLLANLFEDDCRFETNGKTPGHELFFKKTTVKNGIPSKIYSNIMVEYICKELCVDDKYCQMSDYESSSHNCSIYHRVYETEWSSNNQVYQWKFCNLSKGVYFKEGVPGFWFYRVGFRKKLYLASSIWPDCRNACLSNALCGGFNANYRNNNCELLELWKDQKKHYEKGDLYDLMYFWESQSPYTYRIKNEKCRNLPSKPCRGKWEITKRGNEDFYIISIFHTRDFRLCWTTCEYYPQCYGVNFENFTSKCILKSLHNETCNQKMGTAVNDSINVEWSCCSKAKKIGDRYIKQTSCREIKYPENVALLPLTCNYLPLSTKETCKTELKRESRNCYKHQSFLSTKGVGNDSLKVFNGYEFFLILNATENNFPFSNFKTCQMYDASIPQTPNVTITNFQDWYPNKDYKNEKRLILPVKYVIVREMAHQNCLCYVWLQCAEILRSKLSSGKIPYNFIISAKGDIFENRGWNYQSYTFNSSYEYQVVFVAFLGNFKTNTPNIASLSAFKNFIAFGVDHDYIDKEYILLTYDDFTVTEDSNVISLYNVIRAQARYNGIARSSCRKTLINTFILNAVLIMIVTLLLYTFSCYIFKLIHSKGCTILRGEVIGQNMSLKEAYGLSNESSVYLKYFSYFKTYSINNKGVIIVENTSFFWITERGSPLCLYCHKWFQEFFRICEKQRKFVKMKSLEEINKCCANETLCLIFWPRTIFCKVTMVIFHLKQESIYLDLHNVLSSIISNKCICSKYKLQMLDTELKEKKFELLC